ncbi:MAG: hypothetical protein ACMV1B_07090 [Prevotella sp.]
MIKDLFLKIAGGGSSKSTTSTKVEIPKEFQPYLYGQGGTVGILPTAEKLYNSGQLSPTPTKSATTSTAEKMALNTADNLQNQWLPQFQNLYNSMSNQQQLSGSQQLTDAMNAASADLKSQYANVTNPAIEDAALSAGQFGGSRQGIAEGLAKSELDKNILNTNAQLQYGALAQDVQNTLAGQQLAGSYSATLANLMQAPATLYSQVGNAQDTYADAVNAAPAANLINYSEIIRSMLPGTNSATTTSGGGTSTTKSVLGGAASGAAMGSMLAGASKGAITGPVGMGIGAAVGGLAGLL